MVGVHIKDDVNEVRALPAGLDEVCHEGLKGLDALCWLEPSSDQRGIANVVVGTLDDLCKCKHKRHLKCSRLQSCLVFTDRKS